MGEDNKWDEQNIYIYILYIQHHGRCRRSAPPRVASTSPGAPFRLPHLSLAYKTSRYSTPLLAADIRHTSITYPLSTLMVECRVLIVVRLVLVDSLVISNTWYNFCQVRPYCGLIIAPSMFGCNN